MDCEVVNIMQYWPSYTMAPRSTDSYTSALLHLAQ